MEETIHPENERTQASLYPACRSEPEHAPPSHARTPLKSMDSRVPIDKIIPSILIAALPVQTTLPEQEIVSPQNPQLLQTRAGGYCGLVHAASHHASSVAE